MLKPILRVVGSARYKASPLSPPLYPSGSIYGTLDHKNRFRPTRDRLAFLKGVLASKLYGML